MPDSPVAPRAFVSYSWSSPEHEAWVLRLASDLREQGVDVVLDKWDLLDGDDSLVFMERIVTDPHLKKVILVCDRAYVRKADSREGGVGTEAQILTPDLYRRAQTDPDAPDHQKAETRKFVAVLREPALSGGRATPAFYGGRVYIDMTDDDRYGEALDRLVRWAYDQPVDEKPPLGKTPAFLVDPAAPDTGTSVRQRRALRALREGRPEADGAVDEYFETLAENLTRFDFDPDEVPSYQTIAEKLEHLKPVRDEVVAVFQMLVRYRADADGWEPVHLFFQRCLPLLDPNTSRGRAREWSRDHFRIFVQELFLYAVALLLARRRYGVAAYLVNEPFTLDNTWGRGGVVTCAVLQQHVESLAHHYRQQSQAPISPVGSLFKARADLPDVSFDVLMQADLVLALRFAEEQRPHWWPTTLIYSAYTSKPFDLFARAQSPEHFEHIKPVLAVQSWDALVQRARSFGRDGRIWDYRVSIPALITGNDTDE